MAPGHRAAPRFSQPDWLVLREMARVLRGVIADPALRLHGARVLDFGCGNRPYEAWFAAAGARYRGADIDVAHEVRIREDGRVDCADGEYDLVASFQVLEHVWDIDTYLTEARRALRAEGRLLLS
ncbi:MAG TPA: methyltransferase domain-containing protein, partial [Steroidobacteraceae bacterium]|nr:methyltransferase domain-containing protein [Steroidobacteraceae bacterium]